MAIDALGVKVTPEENREYSYTDKKSGYWYGTTHQETPEWWSGWNMAKKRILADYAIGIDDEAIGIDHMLNRKEAGECIVFPDRIERHWGHTKEIFRMFDNVPVLYVKVISSADSITQEQELQL